MDLIDAVKGAKRVYLCGNGGSAANAIHIANDLISVGVRAHALTADVATLTAIANDFGYQHVFSRQLAVFGEPGDLLIALSGSGRSANILRAIDEAHRIGMTTWALVGMFEPELPRAALSAKNFHAEGIHMQDAENVQIRIGHELMTALRGAL